MKKPTYIQDDYKSSHKFNGGSRLVLGTAGLGGVWGKVEGRESVEAILHALEQGVEVIDTAPSYYKAQQYVGEALRKWNGELPFISTKVGRLQAEKADEVYLDYSTDGMRKSIEESLELLSVDFIDLLFLHEPQLVPIVEIDSIMETLQSFQDEGIVGMLGIGGNPVDDFWPYVKKENFDVVSSFLKMDACSLEGLKHDIPKFKDEDIAVYAASSLHMGLLGSKFSEYVEKPPNNEWIRQDHINNAIKVKQIAQQNNMSLADISLRYLFSMKEADRVVIGPGTMEEVRESLSIWQEGPLDKKIFEQVTEVLLQSTL